MAAPNAAPAMAPTRPEGDAHSGTGDHSPLFGLVFIAQATNRFTCGGTNTRIQDARSCPGSRASGPSLLLHHHRTACRGHPLRRHLRRHHHRTACRGQPVIFAPSFVIQTSIESRKAPIKTSPSAFPNLAVLLTAKHFGEYAAELVRELARPLAKLVAPVFPSTHRPREPMLAVAPCFVSSNVSVMTPGIGSSAVTQSSAEPIKRLLEDPI